MVELLLQDKDWEGEGSDEDDASDENVDVSDDDDSYYTKKPKGRQRGKVGQSVKSTRDRKTYAASGRQRRVKSTFEDDESTAEDSDSDSDGDFKSIKKRGVHVRKNNGRSSAATSFSMRNSEVRTSSRTVRKVSYAESEESEEGDEGRKKKSQKVHPSSYTFDYGLYLVRCLYFGVNVLGIIYVLKFRKC